MINNIDSIISFKDSICDLINMDYISKSPFKWYNGLINCVKNATTFLETKELVICSLQTVYHLNRYIKTYYLFKPSKRGKYTLYQYLKMNYYRHQIKLKFVIKILFPTRQYDICDYNLQWFMSSGSVLDATITDMFMNKIEKRGKLARTFCFSKINHGKPYI